MKKIKLLALLLASVLSVNVMADVAPVNTVLWGENFAHFGTNIPSSAGTGTGTTIYDGANITYNQDDTGTKGYNEKLAGGTAPELLLKSGKTWTISNIKTGGATELSLKYLSNNTKSSVTCSTTGVSISGSSKSYTITSTTKDDPLPATITLVFGCSGNTRIDDVELKVTKAGASKTPLTTPSGLTVGTTTSTSANVSWTAGDATNTGSYKVEYKTSSASDWTAISPNPTTTSCTITGLTPSTTYNWRVTAIPSASAATTKDNSEAASGTDFTTEAPAKHKVYFSANGTIINTGGTEVTEGNAINFPATATGCEGKTFMGWYGSNYSHATDAPTYVTSAIMGGSDVTYYAVFADASEGGTSSVTKDIIAEAGLSKSVTLNDDNNPYQMGELPITLTGAKGTSNFPAINYNSTSGTDLRFYKGTTCAVTIATTNDQPITKIEFLKNATTASSLSNITANVGTLSDNVWTGSAKSVKFTYNNSSTNFSGQIYIINVTYSTSGGTTYSNYTTTCAAATDPVIKAFDVNLEYSATSGEIAYTIENQTSATLGATITSGDWISNVQVAGDKVTFSCTANTTQEARTATIKLSYEGATDKNVTITQAAAPYSTIADLYTKAIEVGNTATPVSVKMTNWQVVAISGKNAYVTDGTDGLTVYTDGHGFVANDQLNGTVECKVQLYNNGVELTELTTSKFGDGDITHNIEVSPIEVASIADLKKSQLGALIKLSNLTYNGSALSDGTNTITPYDKLYSGMSFTKDKKYNVIGVYLDYFQSSSFKYSEIMPRGADDIELITYAITINTVGNGSVTCDAANNKACEGDEVALTINPTTGYYLSSLSVTDADGNPVKVTENKFTMPAGNVTVSAVFAEIQKRDVTLHIGAEETVVKDVYDGTPFSAIKPATDPAGTAAGDCADTFVGWATQAITTPTDEAGYDAVKVTAETKVSESQKDFYAVFATASGSPVTWTKQTAVLSETEGEYAIVVDGTSKYIMKASVNSNRFENGTTPTFSDNQMTSTPAADEIWKISKSGDYYIIYNASTGKYAGATSSKNQGALLDDATDNHAKWTISYSSNAFTVINYGRSKDSNDSNNKYLRNNTSNGWATYGSGTGSAPVFYKKAGGVTYSNYITSCCTKYNVTLANGGSVTGGTFSANPARACEGAEVTLTADPATGYQFVAWSTDPTQTIVDNVFTMPDEDVTVSASFELQKHNVTLHKNDGVNPEATDITEYTYGDTKNLKTLATLAWSVDGHIFAGWATSAAGKGEYEDGYAFKLEEENDVDLYATWVEESLRPVTYTSVEHLTYANTNPETVNKDATGFVVAYTVDAHYQVTDAAVTVNGVDLTSGITVGQSGLTIEKADGFDGPIVVTPVVAPIIYNVIWKANGEQFTTNTVQQGSKPTLPAEEPTTCGETILFMGWTNAEYYDHTTPPTVLFNDAASAREVKAEDAVDGTITYYAVYAEVTSTPVAESTVYTSNIDNDKLSDKVNIGGSEENQVAAIKLGTGSTPASSLSFTVPAGTTTITLHAAAWTGSSNATIQMSTEKAGVVITPSAAQSVAANTGATGNSPYKITPADGDFYTFTLSGVTETTTIKVANTGARVVLWGINTATTIISDYSTTCLPALAAPTITTAEGEYCGSVDVEITQPAGNPDGAKIMYSTDNETWNEYTAAVNITTSGTVYAKVVKAPKSTEVVSATYTVYPAYTLADAATAATATSQIACLTFTDLLVQARTQSEAFLKASDGQIVLLNKSSHGLSVGDKLVANDAHVTFVKAHDLLQLTSTEGIAAATTGNATTPEEKAITALVAADYGKLVKIMNVTYDATNKKFIDASSNEIAVDAKFFPSGIPTSWPDGGKFNVTGIVLTNSDKVVIAPRNTEDLESLATPLDKPTNFAVASVNSYQASYSWTAVENNAGYTLYIYDGETEIYKSTTIGKTRTDYAPTKVLEAGHTYTAKLVALGDKAEHSDSPAAEVGFTTNPNAKLNWYVGDNEEPYATTYASQEKVVTPEIDPISPCATNYENFVTWYNEEIVSETGQITALEAAKKVKAGDAAASQAGSAKEYNFYAVFGKIKTQGVDKYVAVTEAITDKDGNEDWRGEFLIGLKEENTETLVVFDGHRPYVDGTTNEPIDDSYNSQSVTLQEEGTVVLATEDINSYRFIFTKSTTEGKYNIQSASGYYIGGSSSSNTITSSTTTKYDNGVKWDAENNEGIEILSGRYLCYNADNLQKRFRYMNTDAGNLILYKRTTTNPQYSGYITTCPQTYTITIANNTKGLVEAATTTEILKGAKVLLTATAYDGYTKTGGAWVVKKTATSEVVEDLVGPTNYLTMPDYDVTIDYNFVANRDVFVDLLHQNEKQYAEGSVAAGEYVLPELEGTEEGSGCDAYYIFDGWVTEEIFSDAPTQNDDMKVNPTYAEGNTYYALWFGEGGFITTCCATPAPENLKALSTYLKATSAKLDWDNVTDATKYHIIVKQGETTLYDTDVEKSEFEITSGLTKETAYDVYVKAYAGCWSENAHIQFTTAAEIKSYSVTINAEGGTYSILAEPEMEGNKIQEGAYVLIGDITVSDPVHYFFKELTIEPKVSDLKEEDGTYSFTMPSKAITINIVFAEYPKVTWKMEGAADQTSIAVLRNGDKFEVGTVKEAPADWKYKTYFPEFAGWVTADKCDAEGNVTTAEFITATTEVPADGLTVYGAVAKSGTKQYQLVTDVANLAANDELVIVGLKTSNSQYYAAGDISGTHDYLDAVEIAAPENDIITIESEDVLVFTLSGEADAWTFKANNKYLSSTGSKANKWDGDYKTWKLANSSTATMVVMTSVQYTSGKFEFNMGSPRFRNYEGSCEALYFYRYSSSIYDNLTINPQPDYGRTDLVVGNYGTVCVPYAVKTTDRSGATFWNIVTSNKPESANPTSITIVKEEGDLEAGKPYIFYAEETTMSLFFSGDKYEEIESVEANGLFGNLTDENIVINDPNDPDAGSEPILGYFFVLQQKLYECGWNCTVGPNRGWVQAAEIKDKSATTPLSAPRRVIGNPNGTPTGIHNLNADGFKNIEGARKYFYNNQIMIVNEDRIYNAQGILIQ